MDLIKSFIMNRGVLQDSPHSTVMRPFIYVETDEYNDRYTVIGDSGLGRCMNPHWASDLK